MIPNKFAYFSHGSTYRTNKEGENISDNSIVFVGDDQSIAARGKIFGVRGVYPGTCTTAAGTAAKVATTSPLFPLDSSGKPLPGTTIAIKFSNTNTYKTAGTTMTLNVNSTGAYPIYYNNAEVVSTTSANTIACGYKNRYTYYIFNGTQWVWLSYGNDANTTYSNVALGQGYAIQNNESESDTVTATLSSYALTTGGIVVVKFIFDVPCVSGPTLNVNTKGAKAIYHNGSPLKPGIIRSGDLATFIYSTNYYLISLDRDFNDPVSVGTLNTNNSTAQTVSSSESFSSNINLHKISKTGSYNDLLNKPTIPTIPDHKTLDGVSLVGSTGDVDKIVFGKLNTNGSFTRYEKVGNEWAIVNVPTNPTARILYVDVFTELSYYYDTVVSQYKLIGPNPDLSGFLTSETPLSMGATTGTGNAVTNIEVSGHQITLNKATTFLTASDITGKADKSAAIGSLSLSLNTTDYKITLTGTYVDGTPFTVSDVIDLPLESVVVSGSYDPSTKKVVLTLKNNSTVEFSIADLISGLQSEITSNNKLSADLVENGTTNKVYTATEQTKLSGIEAGAEVNVQANWNETDSTSDAYILNKPTIPNTLKVGSVAGKLYRNNVGGAGNFSISGNSGCIPNLTAGTFLVAIYAYSSTQSYKFRFNFGSVTYDLETTNGEISDLRTVTISSASTFSGSVVGTSVASGTILYVVMYDYLTPVTTVGPAAVTNRYADLDGTPTLPSASNTTPLLVRGSSGSAGSSGAYARADHKHPICKSFGSYSSLVADTDAQLGEIRYDSDGELFYIYDANTSTWVRLDNKNILPLIVDITSNNDTYTCNKTNAEIYEARQAERDVYVRKGGEYLYPLASEPGSTLACFMGPRYDELGVFDRIYISTVNSTQQVTATNIITPLPGPSNPQMDGTASPGAANTTTYSKSDHVHPSDTSRVPTSRTINGHALSSDLYLTVFGSLGPNGFERDTVNNQGAWAGAEIVTPDPYTTYIDITQNKLYRYNPVVGGGSYVEVGSSGTGNITSTAITDLTDIL